MKFIFKAKNEKGQIKEGKLDALNQDAAVQILQNNGLIPVEVKEEKIGNAFIKEIQKLWEGVNQRELSVFFRQLSTLIEAKVAIVTSLQAIYEQTENKYLKLVTLEILQDVQDGSPLSEAMAKHPNVFSLLMINMVKAGEISGNLQKSVTFLADNSEKNYEINSKIRGAMFYPGFIMSAAVIIGFVVFTVVLPKLTVIFKDLGVEVPWYTKILMNTGDFMQNYWWLFAVLILGGVAGLYYYIKSESGRKDFEHIILKIPVMGNLFKFIYISRFAENLSVLLVGGIPIVRALTIVSDVVSNDVYSKIILKAADEVKSGGNMYTVFARHPEFPPIVSKMIKIGEDAGKVSDVLKNISKFYEREVDRITRNLSSLIEPILIVILGIGVGILVFAILMPIYNISSQMK